MDKTEVGGKQMLNKFVAIGRRRVAGVQKILVVLVVPWRSASACAYLIVFLTVDLTILEVETVYSLRKTNSEMICPQAADTTHAFETWAVQDAFPHRPSQHQ
eukprot:3053613-Amphidinium_carterae.1